MIHCNLFGFVLYLFNMKKLHILCFYVTLFFKSLIFAQQGTLVLPTKDYIQTDSLVSFSWNKYLNADEYLFSNSIARFCNF